MSEDGETVSVEIFGAKHGLKCGCVFDIFYLSEQEQRAPLDRIVTHILRNFGPCAVMPTNPTSVNETLFEKIKELCARLHDSTNIRTVLLFFPDYESSAKAYQISRLFDSRNHTTKQ